MKTSSLSSFSAIVVAERPVFRRNGDHHRRGKQRVYQQACGARERGMKASPAARCVTAPPKVGPGSLTHRDLDLRVMLMEFVKEQWQIEEKVQVLDRPDR